jgi:hypothetical protein
MATKKKVAYFYDGKKALMQAVIAHSPFFWTIVSNAF